MPFESPEIIELSIKPNYGAAIDRLLQGGPGSSCFMRVQEKHRRPDSALREAARRRGWELTVKRVSDTLLFVYRES